MLCQECCSGDLCNSRGCGEQGYPSDRGPVCYNCPQISNPSTCDIISVCNQGEGCYINSEYEFGDLLYHTSCLTKSMCDMSSSAGQIFGKRNTPGDCKLCCYSNLCNNQCGYISTTSTSTTTFTPTSTTSVITTSSAFTETTESHSHVGTKFILLFLENYHSSDRITLIATSEDNTTKIHIESPFSNLTQTSSLIGNGVEIDLSKLIALSGMGLEKKGIKVTSTHPIAVYGFNRINNEAVESFFALPMDKLGTSYKAVTYHPRYSRGSVIGIVAPYNNTKISITVNITSGHYISYKGRDYHKGDVISLILNEFETFQVQKNIDLTGTVVESTKPVAVLSGNRCSDVPGFCNHLVEFLPPVSKWGKKFIVPPSPSNTMILRIVPSVPNTNISIWNVTSALVSDTWEKDLNGSNPYAIICDKPCLVMQYTKYDRSVPPFMMVVPATTQYSNDYVLRRTAIRSFSYNYISVIIKSNLVDGLKMDGSTLKPISQIDIRFKGEEYSVLKLPMYSGNHIIRHVTKGVQFGLTAYGYVRDSDGYGFPGGLAL